MPDAPSDTDGPDAHRVRVAAVQMTSTDDVERNLGTVRRLVRRAADAGARFIGLPENFAFLGAGGDGDHRAALAEPLPSGAPAGAEGRIGPILATMGELARATGTHLLLGGFPEKSPEPGHIYNTSVLLDATGAVIATYRKIHLFDVDLPGGARFRESDAVTAGSEPTLATLPFGPVGLSVCYDLRFPELYRQLAARGARILTVPAAFTAETGKDHWHVLLRARAIENQAFVIAPAQFGSHGGKRSSYGHAMIIDPWGVILAEVGNQEGVAVADLDLTYQDQVRRNLPCLRHRRIT
jgi:predicted amidohydrolase